MLDRSTKVKKVGDRERSRKKIEMKGGRGELRTSHSQVHTAPLHDFIGFAPKPLSQAAKRSFEKHL